MKLLHPGFLMAMGAIAVPIIIHLLQLRKPKRLLFTNNAIIRQVELVTVQHRRLQHLLILLVRVLGICALVLMFCQPVIAPIVESTALGGGKELVLDNSFSMQVSGTAQNSLFQEGVINARRLNEGTGGNGAMTLLTARAGSGKYWKKAGAFETELDGLKLSAQANVARLLRNKPGMAPLYVLSDFQRSGFGPAYFAELDSTKRVVMVPLRGLPVANAYIDSVWVEDAFVRLKTNTGLHIRVRNGGSMELKDCPVKVFLGNRQVAAYRVSLAAGQVATSVVQVQVADAAVALGRVVTEDAPVTFDNNYFFTLLPAANINVLEIGDEPVTQQLYVNESLFNYLFATPGRIDYGRLRKASVVLMRGLASLDAGLREALRAVVQRGGSVVVVPSALVSSRASYQQLFKDLGLGNVQWEESVTAPELREVAMPSAQEPFFRDVFGGRQRAVTMPRVAPVLRWARTGKDILRLRDGESFLANFTSGTGQVYVFSAPFDKAHSDFEAHALFVPVMYRMAMLSYRNEQLPAYRIAQQSISLKLPEATGQVEGRAGREEGMGLRLVKDSLVLLPAQRLVGQEVQLSLPVSLEEPGFYEVRRGDKVLTTLAFNQGKSESELAAYSAEELRQLIGPNRPNIQVVEPGTDGAGLARLQAAQAGQPLWRYCLLVALLCLLAEALLVRFGKRPAAPVGVPQLA